MVVVYGHKKIQIKISIEERGLEWSPGEPGSFWLSSPNGVLWKVPLPPTPRTMCDSTHRVLSARAAYQRLGVQTFHWRLDI